MPDLLRWPFPLPKQFLEALGYRRTVEAFESPAMRARLAALLRQQGITAEPPVPAGPRRFVSLWWESAGDELAWSDSVHGGAGQLQHWAWLDYLHGHHHVGPISGWLIEHEINLGNSDEPATHTLVVDADASMAYVAPIAVARRIVRTQSLDQADTP